MINLVDYSQTTQERILLCASFVTPNNVVDFDCTQRNHISKDRDAGMYLGVARLEQQGKATRLDGVGRLWVVPGLYAFFSAMFVMGHELMPWNGCQYEHYKGWEAIRLQIYVRDGGHCSYCQKKLTMHDFHVDHIVPKSRGGSDGNENLALSCPSCNLKKHAKTPSEAGMMLGGTP